MSEPQLDRIEAKLDRLISGPESPTISIKEVMRLTGTRSRSAAYRALSNLGVKPYSLGKYSRLAVTNAIALRELESRIVQPDSTQNSAVPFQQ